MTEKESSKQFWSAQQGTVTPSRKPLQVISVISSTQTRAWIRSGLDLDFHSMKNKKRRS